jgi:hypothetical protein
MKSFILICLLSTSGAYAQLNRDSREKITPQTAFNPDLVFTAVEKMPNYKGGYSQLEEDLNANLNIGSEAEEKNLYESKDILSRFGQGL